MSCDVFRVPRARLALVAAAVVVVAAGIWPATSGAKRFLRGFSDPVYRSGNAAERGRWLQESVDRGSNVARIDVVWRSVATSQPANPVDPADPAYDFSEIDRAVRDAAARGLPILLTFQFAPPWAEGGERDTSFTGVWKVNPDALGQFAEAVARRYSGTFSPGLSEPPLPRVSYIEPWNEPNLPHFLSPQWKGKKKDKPASPGHYRKMLNAVFAGANRGNDAIKVVGGATAPYGDDPGEGARIRPLRFLRELLCLRKKRGSLEGGRCKEKAKMDVLSHHPITTSGGPRCSAISPDDAAVSDFKNVVEVLRAAEREKTIGPGGRRPAWATEVWWETNPPETSAMAFPINKVARWTPEALYLLERQGASAAVWLQIVDSGSFQTGLFFADGTPKPLAAAWRFPFVTDRISESKVRAWAIPPTDGRLEIQRGSGAEWRTVRSINARAGSSAQTTLRQRGSATFRAVINGEASPEWSQSAGRSGDQCSAGRSSRIKPRSSIDAPSTVPLSLRPYIESP
jgi:hypothetical protein